MCEPAVRPKPISANHHRRAYLGGPLVRGARRRVRPVQVNRAQQMVVDEPLRADIDGRLLPAQAAQAPSLVDVPVVGPCVRELIERVNFGIPSSAFSGGETLSCAAGRTFY